MSSSTTRHTLKLVSDPKQIKEFLAFPYRHYKEDKYWVAPLRIEQKKLIDKRKNAFFQQAEMEMFLIWKDDQIAGRIAAVIDHRYNEHHGAKTGFFGFFESDNHPETARLLFKMAEDHLRRKGMTNIIGPANPGIMDTLGFLVDGFDKYPSILMPYTKPYYPELAETCGYKKEMDLITFEVNQDNVDRDRVNRAMNIVQQRLPGIKIRKIRKKKLAEELVIVREIFNKAWSKNWGFVPLTEAEFEQLGKDLKPVINENFAHIAEIDGQPVGFSVGIPDYNQILRDMDGRLLPFGIFHLLFKRNRINQIRTALMGVIPEYQGKGIDALLHRETIEYGKENGYYASEVGWILESNVQMLRVAERLGGVKDKVYRVYGKSLD